MITGLYSSATAMDSAMKRHEVASQNLANINTTAFRRALLTQSTYDTEVPPANFPVDGVYTSKLLGTATRPVVYDFSQGPIDATGRTLDLSLSGDGFFSVQGPNSTLYTRNGSFHINGDQQLVTSDNMPVLGPYGPIRIPDGATAENIEISSTGLLSFNGIEFGQIQLTAFSDPRALNLEGPSLFAAPFGAATKPPTAVIEQGSLELSNTSSIDEMINLVDASRHFDAAQKALTTISESIQKRIGL